MFVGQIARGTLWVRRIVNPPVPLHFTANVAEAGLATEPTLRMMGTLFPEAAPGGNAHIDLVEPQRAPRCLAKGLRALGHLRQSPGFRGLFG